MKITGEMVAKQALKHVGEYYVYGCKGEILTKDKYDKLKAMYGSMVWKSDANKIGKMCNDCSGLCNIVVKELGGKSYGYNSTMFKQKAKVVKPISDIDNAPIGCFLWMKGHIGIYIGKINGVPYYTAQDGSARNDCKRPLKDNGWTHYLLMDYIDYTFPESKAKIGTKPNVKSTFAKDDLLAKSVSKIIKSGIALEYNSWKREDLIDLKNVPALINKLGGLDKLMQNKIITNKDLWLNKKYNKSHVKSLLVKFAEIIK